VKISVAPMRTALSILTSNRRADRPPLSRTVIGGVRKQPHRLVSAFVQLRPFPNGMKIAA